MADAAHSAYVIGHITVRNAEKWAAYRSAVPATLAPWGAELVLRGTLVEVLNGSHPHSDTVVIRFPDVATVRGWYASASYQALIPLRNEAATVDLLVFES